MANSLLPPGLDLGFLARLLDALGEMVLVVDADHRVVYVNRGAKLVLHREPALLVGKSIGEALGCLHSEDKGCGNSAWCPCGLREHIAEALSEDAPVLRETLGLPIRVGDIIEVRNFKLTLLGVPAAEGRKTRVCAVIDDRTQIVRRSDELRLVQGKLEMRVGQCESMAEMIVEDVRAPLLRIGEALRPGAGAIVTGGVMWDLDLLSLSVDNLLRVSQMDPEGLAVSKEVFDPVPALAETAALLREGAARKSVVLELPAPAPETPLVSADRKMFLRILENLLRNALDQNRPGGTTRLEIGQGGRDQLAIAIVFEGEALPPEHLENIFETYFHLERPGGMGRRNRGLPFCRIAVLAQGGTLRAENREGGQVAYLLTLPARRRPPAAAPAGPPGV